MKDITETHNTARYFTENRHISWVLLLAVFMWGIYGYLSMPKAKDPAIQVRVASVVTSWPGAEFYAPSGWPDEVRRKIAYAAQSLYRPNPA